MLRRWHARSVHDQFVAIARAVSALHVAPVSSAISVAGEAWSSRLECSGCLASPTLNLFLDLVLILFTYLSAFRSTSLLRPRVPIRWQDRLLRKAARRLSESRPTGKNDLAHR